MMGNVLLRNMLTSDNLDHRRLRGLVAKAFTPRRIEEMEPAIESIVTRLIEQLRAADGPVDLRAEFAFPLPMLVLSELFGIGEQDRPRLVALVRKGFGSAVMTPEEGAAFYGEIHSVFSSLIEARRAAPTDDLASALIAARDEGDQLTDAELVDMLFLFVAAGFETTEGAICNTVRALLTHPEQLELVRSGKVGWDAVVEEVLRWDTSLFTLPFSYALEDTDLGGVHVAKGDAILLCYGSAGRDEQHHGSAADTFDVTRPPSRHLAFGRGPHHCMGAPLARKEMTIALPRLFEEFPDLALHGDPARLDPVASIMTNTVQTLPVTYSR
ncbi:cytochrome P450 family protein [Nocardiopsis ansamitocini]